jgi:hypothetical protein
MQISPQQTQVAVLKVRYCNGCVRTEYADFACCVLPVLRAADSGHLGGLQHGLQSSRPLYKPLSPLR